MTNDEEREREGPSSFRIATRLNSMAARPDLYGASPLTVTDMIKRAAAVEGLDAVDLNYPEHVEVDQAEALRGVMEDAGLSITAVNLRYGVAGFAAGAFTNPQATARRAAIDLTCHAVDAARILGARHIILWMSEDGLDYPFQGDFASLWTQELEGIRQVAEYAPDMRVSLEYKPSGARCYPVISTGTAALLAVAELGLPNVGITIDVCHALMAGEKPAHVAALALRRGCLYGVHLNDGYRRGDDGLLVGSVHPVETLELLHTLLGGGYDGAIYFDTFPVREDPMRECAANIAMLRLLLSRAGSLNRVALADIQENQDALRAHALSGDALYRVTPGEGF